MAVEVVRGARIGHPQLRYGFEFVVKGRLCGVQIEFDEAVADDIVRMADPSLIGPRAEWFLDDGTICDRLGEILTAWVATFPLEATLAGLPWSDELPAVALWLSEYPNGLRAVANWGTGNAAGEEENYDAVVAFLALWGTKR